MLDVADFRTLALGVHDPPAGRQTILRELGRLTGAGFTGNDYHRMRRDGGDDIVLSVGNRKGGSIGDSGSVRRTFLPPRGRRHKPPCDCRQLLPVIFLRHPPGTAALQQREPAESGISVDTHGVGQKRLDSMDIVFRH